MKPEHSIDNYTVTRLDILQELFNQGKITPTEYVQVMYAPVGQFQQELEKVLESKKWKSIKKQEIMTVIQTLQTFKDLPENWNTYGASPISSKAIQKAVDIIEYLEDMALDECIRVNVFPLADGGVQIDLDYNSELGAVEIEVWDTVVITYFFGPDNQLLKSTNSVDADVIERFLLGI